MRFDPRSIWSAWPRRVIGLSLAAVLLVAAIVVGVFGFDQSRTPSRASEPLQAPAAGTQARATPSPTAADAITTGPGLTEPGILMEFSPRVDGGFDVAEHVILQTRVSRVVFTPPSRGAAGAMFSKTHAAVVDLQVQDGDGQPLGRVPTGRLTKATSVPLGGTTSALVLRYQLSGTTVRSIPSSAGRALAYVRPITAGFDPTLLVQVVAGGTGTLNLTCPALSAENRACAAGTAPGLRVRSALRGSDSTVVVQLDLPEP